MFNAKPLFHVGGLAFALALAIPLAAQAQTYTFAEAVRIAISANPEMDVAKARLMQAQSALGKANASEMPQINFSVTGSYSNNALNVFGMKLQQRQATVGDFGIAEPGAQSATGLNTGYEPGALNNPGPHSDVNTRIEVLYPVYNGGKVASYQKQAREMIDAAGNGEVAVEQYLTFGVYQAFEAVHAARSFITVAEQAKKTAQEFVRTTENLVRQGVVVRSELLSAKVNASAADVALAQAKGQEQIALDGLRILMGLQSTDAVDVAERLDIRLPDGDLASILAHAIDKNPQLAAQRKQATSSLYAVDAARADEKPSFNVMARQDWNDESIGLESSSYTLAGVFSWKVSDFGLTENTIKMAQAEAQQKQAETASMENKVKFEIMQAWHRLQVAREQVTSSKLTVEQAVEAQFLVTKRYENGVATFTELMASQTQLDKARADLVAAEFEVNVQKAKLRLAAGSMDVKQL
ncbi:RND transporter [Thiosulfatimonas sediminis]|uniref:RND transporter n=1 Tax=Thiosulfatimonas sediminis TaxID=2675054 RepID=A0A6F8PX12_9GAMM|nr:TolC family protein [Thiosulfatimonas sediminis]BBP46659.1 RND transporter [Thiosulfatimonas sediminis]